jgi:FtsP/CotA-like multicopper oxidase with cupredoxin domain
LGQFLGYKCSYQPASLAENNVSATEDHAAGTTEIWQIANLTLDSHPIHFHLVNVQILWRRPTTWQLISTQLIQDQQWRLIKMNSNWKEDRQNESSAK